VSVPIAYIAGAFPKRSETFVYREVRALRAAGWPVTTVSLNRSQDGALGEFADLAVGTVHVYDSSARATVASALVESVAHPLRSIRTLATALADTLRPGERTSLGTRARLLAQSVAAMGLALRLRKAGVRHVHCHFAHAPTTVGMYAARHLGVPFSFTGHANDLFQRRALLTRKLQRAAFVACISEWHRELYNQLDPTGERQYRVIRCGVDVDGWAPQAGAAREIPPGEPLRVLTVCRLVEKKGVDTLISGLAALSRPWKLTIAGDGPERRRLEQLARKLGCFGSIEWLGQVGNERVLGLLAQADVFALPCREDRGGDRDGIPVVLMEAMSCGVPVVSGDLPAIRELVRQDETGVLVDGNRAEQVTAALEALAASRDLRQRLAAAGREHVRGQFSLNATLDQLTLEIQQAAKSGARDRRAVRKASATPVSN
jgi:glycosyltransferase involved in cell wall biosynthesis